MSDALDSYRAEITEIDRLIFDAINRRLDLVAQLKRYKAEHGIDFVDPERERRMVDERAAENRGPLSDAGLRGFYAELLALVKRELDEP
ncbi:MAG TPA: chorismate mutase [Gaiellaceae bacterium]|jgi:3-deoxy-7-phosphoheptulonate synthase/chorismate mutase|nr:chorismate mutase [Gaiellaceae bacterium]